MCKCFAEGMSAVTQERVKLESDLHQALHNGQFELHYQPRSIPRAVGSIQCGSPDPLAPSTARPRATRGFHCHRR